MAQGQRLCVADAERVFQTLDRLASEISVVVPDDATLLGVKRRGAPLAQMLSERIEHHSGRRMPVVDVKVKRYADDLSVLHQHPKLDADHSPDVSSSGTIVIVDDVLFTGRSLLRVLEWLQPAAPERVYAVVLCARDAQELPLRADFVGMQFDIGPYGNIEVHVPPYEEDTSVWLSISDAV